MTSKLCASRMAKRKSTSTGCSLKKSFLLKFSKETEQGTDYSKAFESNKMNFFKTILRLPDFFLLTQIHEDNINILDYYEKHH